METLELFPGFGDSLLIDTITVVCGLATLYMVAAIVGVVIQVWRGKIR